MDKKPRVYLKDSYQNFILFPTVPWFCILWTKDIRFFTYFLEHLKFVLFSARLALNSSFQTSNVDLSEEQKYARIAKQKFFHFLRLTASVTIWHFFSVFAFWWVKQHDWHAGAQSQDILGEKKPKWGGIVCLLLIDIGLIYISKNLGKIAFLIVLPMITPLDRLWLMQSTLTKVENFGYATSHEYWHFFDTQVNFYTVVLTNANF